MVSLEDGAYRLTSITESPPGKLKLIFDFGSVDHPIYGKSEPLRGEIPLFFKQEDFPVPNYFFLSKEEQTQLLDHNAKRLRHILDNMDEDEVRKTVISAIMLTALQSGRYDCRTGVFEMLVTICVSAAVVDDWADDMEVLSDDLSATSRMVIEKFSFDYLRTRSGKEEDDTAYLDNLGSFLPPNDQMRLLIMDILASGRKEFPNGLPEGFKFCLKHATLSMQAGILRYRANDPMPLSEDMQKVVRGYDAGFGGMAPGVLALHGVPPVCKKIRKSLLYKLLDEGVTAFGGLINDIIGIEKDIRKEATHENTILRSVVRDGETLEEAFNGAVKRIQNLVADLDIICRRLLEAFPEDKELHAFVDCSKYTMDGQTVAYIIAAQIHHRYGTAVMKIVPA